jgi:hypothetical protein
MAYDVVRINHTGTHDFSVSTPEVAAWLDSLKHVPCPLLGMDSNANIEQCLDCARLLGRYEALTFEQARIHNWLDLSRIGTDRKETKRLTLLAFDVTARRDEAREAFREHQVAGHDFGDCVTGASPGSADSPKTACNAS